MTKTITASFEGPNRYNFLTDDAGEESLATGRQKRTLTDLIFQNIEDEERREEYLQHLDEMTKAEASDLIIEFTMGRWR